MPGTQTIHIRYWLQKIDWKLFIFLLLFLNVKLVIKVIALLAIYLLRPDFRFGFRFNKNSRLPLFYILMIGIALINWIATANFFDVSYNFVILTGIAFWLLCILAIHQIKLSVDTTEIPIIHNTLFLFFISNAIFSFLNLGSIIVETGAINPFIYQGLHQKYFIGTGDAIRGITFDTSTTNAIINAFGVVYSLKRSKFILTLICMSAMLLTGSNFTTIVLLASLLFLFIFQSTPGQKSIIIVCLFMLMIFLVRISPQNGRYITGYFQKIFPIETVVTAPVKTKLSLREKPDSLLSKEEKKQKIAVLYLDSVYSVRWINDKKNTPSSKLQVESPFIKPFIPKPDIHTELYQRKKDTVLLQKRLLEFAKKNIVSLDTGFQSVQRQKKTGKLVAFQQTINFLHQHPAKLLTGTGMGNFSSKLAIRATGLGVAGGYPAKFIYINDHFKNNHLTLYLDYFSKDIELHSLVNTPNSVYDQLLAEYGLAGFFSFVFLYLGFFIKHLRRLTYGVALLIILIGACGVEYWFEQLSIIILFELMMFLNAKETKKLQAK
jgi:hypothetical protein